jgi:capsular exopolysaccharide synthesis family protein
MSHIFDALQQSEVDGTGFSFPTADSLVASLLKSAEGEARVVEEPPANDLSRFPSLGVFPPQNSRLVSLTDPSCLAAEKFRLLGVRLRQVQQRRPVKKILITSTIPEEGKTVVCGNLAVTLARKKAQKILLLDGDLRRPALASRFGLQGLFGLSEWLQRDASSLPNIYHLEQVGLWLLPAGHPPANPLELMQSGLLADLLERLSSWFDWVVIDSPPILPLADTTVLARLADGILLVTREGTSEKRQLEQGLQTLDQSKLLGIVLNGYANADHTNYYQRYGPLAELKSSPIANR